MKIDCSSISSRSLLQCGLILLSPVLGNAAITLQNWSSSPWNLTGGATSFSATQTDPVYEGGTDAVFSFANPLDGVDITDPANPDSSSATASFFGVEGTGFGVGETTVGRFDRNESFSFQADHAFQLNGISWAEYQGDESIQISWTSGGLQMSELFDLATGAFYTTTAFSEITVDANTPVTITNVSDSSAGVNGRLRIKQVIVELIDGIVLPEVGETHRLQSWTTSPWNLVGGDTAFSASVTDTIHGDVLVSFSDPLSGIDISDPDLPDFTSASSSIFGVEGTGFGVGESWAGRFTRGESFTIQAEQAFELQAIRWAEYSGDETLYLTWTSDGVPLSTTIAVPSGAFYTELPFVGIYPDANTPLEIVNVSGSSAYLDGRLRVNYIDIAFQTALPEPEGLSAGAIQLLNTWDLWPWNATGGDYTMSGTLIAPENGGTDITYTFTAQSGVDITVPTAPDFTGATSDYFGYEATGFGVGEAYVGRFDRGESITLIADHDTQLDAISWRELDGDEQLHISWTSEGVAQSAVFDITTSTFEFTDMIVDANTSLVMTNVSPSTSSLNGRLRIQQIQTRGIYSTAPYYDHSGADGFNQMFGVNLAGAEFGGYAFWQTDPAEWNYYNTKGLNLIRIPFTWERIQSSLYGAVDFTNLDAVVAMASARGMKVVLDMHNYARYNGDLIGSTNVPNAAFEDVWRQIADHYKNESAIYGYGIMNEPHDTGGLWPAAAQSGTDGIREVDTSNWIIVGGDNWSSASAWRTSNADLDVYDPSGKVMYEAHVYFDSSWPSGDGVYGSYDSENPSPLRGLARVHPFILWCQEKGVRGFIGEYGTPKDDIRWNNVLDPFMSHIQAYGMSGTYWAGGKNWSDYALDCSPTNSYTVDSFQMEVLENYTE
ncbi:glycoside hydrolase family 5 protein [Coraliomargarita parva]|uniref:glycoside hydrolase family 5 protein n=1 Tax=Coraliomargarita parva TaxID=3014050 RepID=UPI0022B374BD|nr:glycoside hydrolase family 5 protein [Coraliomargarita parva]